MHIILPGNLTISAEITLGSPADTSAGAGAPSESGVHEDQ